MMAMSTLLGLPLTFAADRFVRAERALRSVAAVGSVVVGLVLLWEI
jgi:hypothetical protein